MAKNKLPHLSERLKIPYFTNIDDGNTLQGRIQAGERWHNLGFHTPLKRCGKCGRYSCHDKETCKDRKTDVTNKNIRIEIQIKLGE